MPRLIVAALAAVIAAIVSLAAIFVADVANAQIPQSPPAAPQLRIDPYKNYKFRVVWDGRIISGVSHVSALMRFTQVTSVLPGNGQPPTSIPGRTTYESITLEREVTRDPAFEAWADLIDRPGGAAPQSIRKTVEISVLDETGRQLLLLYRLVNCWPTEYTALSELKADPAAAPMQRLTLTCELWDRDRSAGTGP